MVWLPMATVSVPDAELRSDAGGDGDGLAASAGQHQGRSTATATATAMVVVVPQEQRWLAGNEYVVESYAALKSLSACPDNSDAACVFSGIAIIIRCNGNTLDANQEKRFFKATAAGRPSRCTDAC